jgi:hypothetical protein
VWVGGAGEGTCRGGVPLMALHRASAEQGFGTSISSDQCRSKSSTGATVCVFGERGGGGGGRAIYLPGRADSLTSTTAGAQMQGLTGVCE